MEEIFHGGIKSILGAVVWTFLGLVLLWVSYKFISKLTPFDDVEELKRGNVAVAIFLGSYLLAIALIIVMNIR